MISSTIVVPGDKRLLALLKAEEKSFSHPRTSYTVADGKSITINITAEDATALKTVVSSVCRVVAVYEKAKGV